MKEVQPISKQIIIRASIEEFLIPPVKDGLVLGKRSPIGCRAIQKALELLTPDQFEHIEFEDEVLSNIIIRKAILNRITKKKLLNFVVKNIKPLMTESEILHLDLQVIINLEEKV